MKYTNRQILSLADAINALDGQSVTQIVDGKPATVFSRSEHLSQTAGAGTGEAYV